MAYVDNMEATFTHDVLVCGANNEYVFFELAYDNAFETVCLDFPQNV
jgi:hypothetical protein